MNRSPFGPRQVVLGGLAELLLSVSVVGGMVASPLGPRLAAAAEPTAQEILRRADQTANQASDQWFESKLRIINPNGSVKEGMMHIWQKGGEKRLIRFYAPADFKGMAVLVENRDASYVYLPGFQRDRRIAAHSRNQGFIGSDFTYDDMATTWWSKDYEAKLLGSEPEQWVLELRPKPGRKEEYPLLKVRVSKKYSQITLIEYHDASGQKLRSQVREDFRPSADVYVPRTIRVIDHRRNNHMSEMLVQKHRANAGISDDMFTRRQLARAE
jgi:outer membrane lipoprotein-sorting protein